MTADDHANTVREHERFMWGNATTEEKRESAKEFDAALDALQAQAEEWERRCKLEYKVRMDTREMLEAAEAERDRLQDEANNAHNDWRAMRDERDEHAETIRCMGEWLDEAKAERDRLQRDLNEGDRLLSLAERENGRLAEERDRARRDVDVQYRGRKDAEAERDRLNAVGRDWAELRAERDRALDREAGTQDALDAMRDERDRLAGALRQIADYGHEMDDYEAPPSRTRAHARAALAETERTP